LRIPFGGKTKESFGFSGKLKKVITLSIDFFSRELII